MLSSIAVYCTCILQNIVTSTVSRPQRCDFFVVARIQQKCIFIAIYCVWTPRLKLFQQVYPTFSTNYTDYFYMTIHFNTTSGEPGMPHK